MTRALIIGGGILGTAHAMEALGRGWEVTQFEVSAEPQASTPRSPGVLRFSRCAPGLELQLGMAAARAWRELAARADRALIRDTGSIVVATDDLEASVMAELADRVDAEDRCWRWLDEPSARAAHPELGGQVRGILTSDLDLVVEPRALLENLRGSVTANDRYTFRGGVEVREVGPDSITDANGRTHRGDLVVLCPGSRSDLTVSVLRQPPILRSIRLQMAQTERFEGTLPTPVSDLAALGQSGIGRSEGITGTAADPRLGSTEVGLTCVQRLNHSLTVGEARDQNEPFSFDVAQRPTDVLMNRLRVILGSEPPPVTRQWVGSVRQCVDGRLWLREDLDETVSLVTGAGQRGIMLAPVIAEETFNWLADGIDSGATRPGADGGRVD
ncbi:MAG: FAD-binding oxidoreductase [Microthrixaceae bacterium]|nr:FAD-binding oxidoreductase [Microthrixaceae bacterium]